MNVEIAWRARPALERHNSSMQQGLMPLFPLQVVLRQILIQSKVDPSQMPDTSKLAQLKELQQQLKYSLIVIGMIPPLLVYPFVQKHFVKGAMVGSLKG